MNSLFGMALGLNPLIIAGVAPAADKLIGFQSARTMSQAMPWIADEVGLFRKYDLDFQLVYISSSQMVTAAILSGIALSQSDSALSQGSRHRRRRVDRSRGGPGRHRPGVYRQREKHSHHGWNSNMRRFRQLSTRPVKSSMRAPASSKSKI